MCMQMCFDTTRDSSGSDEKSRKNACVERRGTVARVIDMMRRVGESMLKS